MVMGFFNSFNEKQKVEMGQVFKALIHMAICTDIKR